MANEDVNNYRRKSPDRISYLDVRAIQPATVSQIENQIQQAYLFAVHSEKDDYGRGRGANAILEPGRNYAELPGFNGRSSREIVETLPEGSTVLDVGCGYGQLGAEILGTVGENPPQNRMSSTAQENTPPINNQVEVYGFDAQEQEGQDRLSGMAIGNIDDLSSEFFGGNPKDFDLVISSSVLYHLPDYWGSVLRMSRVLKPKGIILASTAPRVLERSSMESVEDERGYLAHRDDGSMSYYRSRNVFDVSGKIVPPAEVIDILNDKNENFKLEYGIASSGQMGAITNGGQISGQRMSSDGNLDLSSMFYCMSLGSLGYIIARSPAEKEQLAEHGYINLHDRLGND